MRPRFGHLRSETLEVGGALVRMLCVLFVSLVAWCFCGFVRCSGFVPLWLGRFSVGFGLGWVDFMLVRVCVFGMVWFWFRYFVSLRFVLSGGFAYRSFHKRSIFSLDGRPSKA